MSKFIEWVNSLLCYMLLMLLVWKYEEMKEGTVEIFILSILVGVCSIYLFCQMRRIGDERKKKATRDLYFSSATCVSYLLIAVVGLNPANHHAYITNGMGPRVASSRLFLRLPWERYSIEPIDPFGSIITAGITYPLTINLDRGEFVKYQIFINFDLDWTNQEIPQHWDSDATLKEFSNRLRQAFIAGHDEFDLQTLSDKAGNKKFEEFCKVHLREGLAENGFILKDLKINRFHISLEETQTQWGPV